MEGPASLVVTHPPGQTGLVSFPKVEQQRHTPLAYPVTCQPSLALAVTPSSSLSLPRQRSPPHCAQLKGAAHSSSIFTKGKSEVTLTLRLTKYDIFIVIYFVHSTGVEKVFVLAVLCDLNRVRYKYLRCKYYADTELTCAPKLLVTTLGLRKCIPPQN